MQSSCESTRPPPTSRPSLSLIRILLESDPLFATVVVLFDLRTQKFSDSFGIIMFGSFGEGQRLATASTFITTGH